MAKQVINIGTTANDGTGDPLRSAFDKVNDNFTELYSDDAGDVNSITATAPIVRDSPDGSVTISLADDGITYAKLGTEFKTSAAVAALAVDFSSAQVFTKTITADSTLTFSNVETGMVISLVLTGGTAVTLPASVNVISGTYDPAVSNLIQITSTNDSTEQWAVISKPAA